MSRTQEGAELRDRVKEYIVCNPMSTDDRIDSIIRLINSKLLEARLDELLQAAHNSDDIFDNGYYTERSDLLRSKAGGC